jgi:chitin synthase
VAPYKMLGFVIFGIAYAGYGTSQFFDSYSAGWGNHSIIVQEVQPILSENLPNFDTITKDLEKFTKFSTPNAILWVFLCQITCSYVAYIFAKFACKIHIQTFSFSFPVNLTVPIGVFGLLIVCGLRQTDTCFYHNVLPDYMFFNTPPVYYITEFLVKEYAWIWLLWLISQTWITRHLWRPKSDKNASTEKLFISPWYNSLLIDQSLTLNRRRVDQEDFVKKINIKLAAPDVEMPTPQESEGTYDPSSLGIQPFDKIPQVFICATMWHENKEEMMEFLKSILRLDEDQCARRMAKKYIQIDPNEIDHEYYDLESK